MSRTRPEHEVSFEERLRVPLRWWAVSVMFWASVLLAFLVALPEQVALAIAVLLGAGAAAALVRFGSAHVRVDEASFVAGRAQIPVSLLRAPAALDAAATRSALGVDADARAYLLVRPYLRRAVRVEVADPADPTPYWLVTTRHPDRLAAALAAAIGAPPARV